MISRRRFINSLGLLSASTHGRLDLITNDDAIKPAPYVPDPLAWDDDTITACWIGHSTILLSHAHMDHLDLPSMKQFDRTIPLVMAPNTSDVIADLEYRTVYELDWGKWTNVADVRAEALQVKHFGWRYPWEEDRSKGNPEGRSYNAYLLSRNGRHVVFGGDTAYQEYFGRLRTRNIAIDLAMMPIGCYDPWIRNHANPEQAITMTDQMGAANILPMHWGTFIQSDEPVQEPIIRLRLAAPSHSTKVALESVGETWSLHGGLRQRAGKDVTAPRPGS